MDAHSFDRMVLAVATRLPRRSLAGLLGLSSLGAVALADAKKKSKKKKKKIKRNEFGCVSVGKYCKNDGQCCSGICEGKKKKRKCKAHDESTCQPGQYSCEGVPELCTTTAGFTGQCGTTTGKASYCYSDGTCAPCSKDADCEPTFGTGAACIVCAECLEATPQGTGCVGIAAAL
jgi:hypothetical protein